MYTKVDEPVEVAARFRDGKLEPLAFRWQGRTISGLSLSLAHKLAEGRATLFVCAVSDGASSYELSFNNETLEWKLRQIWAGG
jgi:hypothetical protein